MTAQRSGPEKPFRLEEATIEALHATILSGQTTCVAVVQHYLARVRAYNGIASVLVTQDGAPIPAVTGAVRAQAPLRFPTHSIKMSTILPDLDQYTGLPLEYGRMEVTVSDPAVAQRMARPRTIPDPRMVPGSTAPPSSVESPGGRAPALGRVRTGGPSKNACRSSSSATS
jgi:amidase